MPIYAYAYVDEMGYLHRGEVGARDLTEASVKVRLRMKTTLGFVLWNRNWPPAWVLKWLEEWLKKY